LIALLQIVLKFDPGPITEWIKPRAPILCACCGAPMTIVRTQIRPMHSTGRTTPIPTHEVTLV
jgi:hypothetical protein